MSSTATTTTTVPPVELKSEEYNAYAKMSFGQHLSHYASEYGQHILPCIVTWSVILGLLYKFDDLSSWEPLWEKIMGSYSPFVITTLGTFIIHESAYFSAAVPWLLLDQIPFFQKYKIQARPNEKVAMWACFKHLMFSHVMIQAPMMLATYWFLSMMGFELHAPLPRLSTMMGKCVVNFIIEDFYFYWVHRFLHWKKIYKHVHKVHHTHAAPFGIAAEYAHPIETAFLGVGTILGPIFTSRHLLDLWVWLVIRLCETIEDHSGYDLPWSPTNYIPFWAGAGE